MKTLYKVGDYVKIREDLMLYRVYKSKTDDSIDDVVMPSMFKLRGTVQKIKEVSHGKYILENDFYRYKYTDEMIERKLSDKEILKMILEEDNFKIPSFDIRVEKVIFNNPATIVFYRVVYEDGKTSDLRKSIAKCNTKFDKYDEKIGLKVAMLKILKKEIDKELSKY
jgi:hypothetical protein